MENYYSVLGLKSFEDNIDSIEKAYVDALKSSNNKYLIDEAYLTLKNKDSKSKYDTSLRKYIDTIKSKRGNRYLYEKKKKIRNIKIAITSISLAAVMTLVGCSVLKLKREVLPTECFIGSYVSQNDSVRRKDLKSDFIIIEFPNYEQEITKKTVKNIEKCINERKNFGFNIKTNATTVDDVRTEVYRFDRLVDEYKFSYPVSIEFNNEENYSDENLITLINAFNKELINKNYLVEISISTEKFDKIKNNLDASVRIRLKTDNKYVNNEMAKSLVFNDGAFGIFFGNTETDGLFDTAIYTKEKYPYFVVSNNLNNNAGAESLIGIDASFYDGNIDWKEVKDSIDFTILRICDFKDYHTNDDVKFKDVLDSKFNRNLEMCNALDIPYGFSVYSRAETVSEARTEAKLIVNYLKSKGVKETNFPIFLSIDSCNNEKIDELLDSREDKVVEIANEFCNVIEASGYTAGISMNENDRSRFCSIKGSEQALKNRKFLYTRYASQKEFSFDTNINEYGNVCDYEVTDSPEGTYAVRFTEEATLSGVDSETSVILIKNY